MFTASSVLMSQGVHIPQCSTQNTILEPPKKMDRAAGPMYSWYGKPKHRRRFLMALFKSSNRSWNRCAHLSALWSVARLAIQCCLQPIPPLLEGAKCVAHSQIRIVSLTAMTKLQSLQWPVMWLSVTLNDCDHLNIIWISFVNMLFLRHQNFPPWPLP